MAAINELIKKMLDKCELLSKGAVFSTHVFLLYRIHLNIFFNNYAP